MDFFTLSVFPPTAETTQPNTDGVTEAATTTTAGYTETSKPNSTDNYLCTDSACDWGDKKENVDWGYYSRTNGNCSICRSECQNDTKCGGFECGDDSGYCSWWKKGSCLLFELTSGGFTCLETTEGYSTCKFENGDAVGGTEKYVGKAKDAEHCVALVWHTEPYANGATWDADSGNNDCYAEFNAIRIDVSACDVDSCYQACIFPAWMEMYQCFDNGCTWDMDAKNIDWGYYSTANGNCSFCVETCGKNVDCEAVECGGDYCSWWKNGKCKEVHELSRAFGGETQTCIKRMYLKDNYVGNWTSQQDNTKTVCHRILGTSVECKFQNSGLETFTTHGKAITLNGIPNIKGHLLHEWLITWNNGDSWLKQKACKAVSGLKPYQPCKFPFTYQGVTHHRCTLKRDSKYWCATQTSSSWYEDGYYGYCDSRCPLEDIISLGCWHDVKGDRAIPDYHGDIGIHGCYEKTKSLGNKVFSVWYGQKCFTSSTAGDTYKKYGPRKDCVIEVFEIENAGTSQPSAGTDKPNTKPKTTRVKIKGKITKSRDFEYALFSVYVLLIFVHLGYSCAQRDQNGRVYLKPVKEVFTSTCFILAGYMALTQALRYLNNDDSTSIGYNTFNETPADRYPTFSLCLFRKSTVTRTLQYIFDEDLKRKIGIGAYEYNQFLKGADIVKNHFGTDIVFSNISQIDHKQFTFKLESFMYAFALETEDSIYTESIDNYKGENESLPFYTSYADPDTICFTRKSETEYGLIRKQDWLSLALDYLKRAKVNLQLYIHHPGQLIRSLGKPNFVTYPSNDLDNSNGKITLNLNHVSVLRKRPNAKVPCDANLQDDDNRFKIEVIRHVGCIPIYWMSVVSIDDSFRFCTTSLEMAHIYEVIKNKEAIMAFYKQPCDYMTVYVGTNQHAVYADSYVLVELVYRKKNYEEFINGREFTFESFFSDVGGFVGIFLGYSLLQMPDLLDRLWFWCPIGKAMKKKILLNKTRAKDNKSRHSSPV